MGTVPRFRFFSSITHPISVHRHTIRLAWISSTTSRRQIERKKWAPGFLLMKTQREDEVSKTLHICAINSNLRMRADSVQYSGVIVSFDGCNRSVYLRDRLIHSIFENRKEKVVSRAQDVRRESILRSHRSRHPRSRRNWKTEWSPSLAS